MLAERGAAANRLLCLWTTGYALKARSGGCLLTILPFLLVLCCRRLQRLPLYSLGVSSGASFALKMPRFLEFSGVLSEALGLDPKTWGYDEVVGGERARRFMSCQRVGAAACKLP